MAVLDASALLALIYRETGHERVAALLDEQARVSAPGWSEVLQTITTRGGDAERIGAMLQAAGLHIEPLGADDARRAARLHPHTRQVGLGLSARACLALAARLGHTAVTADQTWSHLHGLTVDGHTIHIDLLGTDTGGTP
ncbi:PIN domain-containing protein [Actinopolyspora halophila]|uniref:PIN domain-containing protein n=1 Tax=Actinopolyspora halophila TaxID=1850 RepID=UPI0003632AD7|nr:PIN domain-containing protein [Actinopolyspora halophila]